MEEFLHIQLFGSFQLTYCGEAVRGLERPRLQSLLSYLLLHQEAPLSRAQLAFTFWPDSSEPQAFTNFRKHLHLLRRVLPQADRFIHADTLTIGWRADSPYRLDVREFEDAVAKANRAERQGDRASLRSSLESAACIYQGELLRDLYDDWILVEREHFRQLFNLIMGRLVVLLEEDREYLPAANHVQRWLREDPLNEPAYRHLMRLYALDGDRARALRTYHTCVSKLQRELGVKPSIATQKIYQKLLGEEIGPRQPRELTGGTGPLVGRYDEWSKLTKCWRTAGQRSLQFVLISGEAGMGKTRLAEEFLDWAARQGIRSAFARCYQTGANLAFAPLVGWLRTEKLKSAWASLDPVWLRELSGLLPEIHSEVPNIPQPSDYNESWGKQRLFDALVHAYLACSQAMLILDDIHWCDPGTLEWLGHFFTATPGRNAESLEGAQILVVATVRSEEVDGLDQLQSLLRDLQHTGRIAQIELEPLSEEETAALATNAAGHDLPEEYLSRLYRETVGNPLFVVETIRSGFTGRLPQRVQQVLISRLAQLMPETRRLAGVAAVIGREFTYDLIARASQEEETVVVNGLDELWHRRIIRERGDRDYEFTHPLICAAALEDVSPVRRRFVHRRIAQALEEVYANRRTKRILLTPPLSSQPYESIDAQIARHYEHAGLPEKAVPYYRRAADSAMQVYATRQAIELYRRGVDGLSEDDASGPAGLMWEGERVGLLVGLGRALELRGEHVQARQSFLEALECLTGTDALHASHLHRLVGDTYKAQGDYAQAAKAYDRAEAALKQVDYNLSMEARHEWLDLQFSRIFMLYGMGEADQMLALGDKMSADIERYGTAAQKAEFYHASGVMRCRRDRYLINKDTLTYARKALKAYTELGDLNGIAEAQFGFGFASLWSGDLVTAEESLCTALQSAQLIGKVSLVVMCQAYLSTLYRLKGYLDLCKAYAERCLEQAKSLGMLTYAGIAQANLAWQSWKTGDREVANELAPAALDLWQASVYPFQWTAHFLIIALALERGDLSEAIHAARALLEPTQQKLPESINGILAMEIKEWDRGNSDRAVDALAQLIAIAVKLNYI